MAPRRPATSEPALRRTTRHNASALENPKKNTDRVSKKAAKPKPQKYDCTTCDRTLAASAFPNYLATDKCKHLINTCKQCCKAWISAQLESKTYNMMSCPECPELLNNEGVRMLAEKKVYTKFNEMERRQKTERVPGRRWCLNPKCKAGQVHEPLLRGATAIGGKSEEAEPEVEVSLLLKRKGNAVTSKALAVVKSYADEIVAQDEELVKTNRISKRGRTTKPKPNTEIIDLTRDDDDDPNIFTCNTCNAKACVPCDKPYHDGETCAEAEERYEQQNEKATKEYIKNDCKQCPKCNKNIEKAGGCDYMRCTQCYTTFCWRCGVDYNVIKNSGHGKECTYAQPGAIDLHDPRAFDFDGPPQFGRLAGQALAGQALAGRAAIVQQLAGFMDVLRR